MADVLIIGDDLTGSNATGALYAKDGSRVVTVTSLDMAEQIQADIDVLVFNTESRHLPVAEAAERTRQVVERASGWDVQIVKRVDTTLRGNIGAEIQAALNALRRCTSGRYVALMVPAFPDSGRVTLGGLQLVQGVPVHRSWAAKDPFTPVQNSRIATILAEHSDLSVAEIGLDSIGDEMDSLLEEAARNADVVVVDSFTDSDLRQVAQAASRIANRSGIHWLVVDTGPFGVALGASRGLGRRKSGIDPLVLVIAGSLTEQTDHQLQHLVANTDAALITVDPMAANADEIVGQLRSLAASSRSVVGVRTCPHQGSPSAAGAERTLSLLGEIARRAETLLRPAAVYATGGDVAMTVLGVLGGVGFRITKEVLPLAVIGTITGGPFSGTGFATKGGLIGADDAALLCVTALQQAARQASETALVDVLD